MKQYRGKAEGMIPVNLMIDQSTYALLTRLAPTRRGKSAFVTTLIHRWEAEAMERQRWEERLQATVTA
jgi:hypothetical protein